MIRLLTPQNVSHKDAAQEGPDSNLCQATKHTFFSSSLETESCRVRCRRCRLPVTTSLLAAGFSSADVVGTMGELAALLMVGVEIAAATVETDGEAAAGVVGVFADFPVSDGLCCCVGGGGTDGSFSRPPYALAGSENG